DPVLGYTLTSGALQGSDELSGALSREVGEDVGTYDVLVGSLSAGTNYAVTFESAELEITMRTLRLSDFVANDKSYDGTTSATGAAFSDDRVAGDELEFGFTAAFGDADAGMNKTVNFNSGSEEISSNEVVIPLIWETPAGISAELPIINYAIEYREFGM